MSKKLERAFDIGASCLTEFRHAVLLPEVRDRFKLSLFARDPDYPDGSRDMMITEDSYESLVAAVQTLMRREAEGQNTVLGHIEV